MYARTISIQDVITAYNKNHKLGNRKAILKAFRYADARHMGSKRGSGEPYINHPLRVARFVASWGFESDVVAAALLHDVVEDCDVPLSDIEKQFGSTTSQIVDAVTALSDRDFADHTLTKAQKDLLSDAKLQRKMNERALFVKIADRIDNLSTLDGVPEEKRIPKAEHTRDIIIPMAILEHAYQHVDTLEELCFEIEHPQKHQMIAKRVDEICEINRPTCQKTIELLRKLFTPGRQAVCDELAKYQPCLRSFRYERRSIVSIYRQITREANNIEKDLTTLLVKDRIAFYNLIIILNDRVRAGRVNCHPFELFFLYFEKLLSSEGLYLIGYKVTSYGDDVYFILADEMDNLYRLFIKTETEYKRYMCGNIIDPEGEFSIDDVNEIEPCETFNKKIRVFRKDGSAFMIDKGATVLDFAFYIHSELGFHFDYAMIDDSKTQLPAYTRLNDGDKITIVTDEQITPSITWFNYLRTRRAVHHLVNYFQGKVHIEST